MKQNFIDMLIWRSIVCVVTFVATGLLPSSISGIVWTVVYGAFALSVLCGLVAYLMSNKSLHTLLCWLLGVVSLGVITQSVLMMDGVMSYLCFCSVLVVDGCIAVFEEQARIN